MSEFQALEEQEQQKSQKRNSVLYCLTIVLLIILGIWGSTLSDDDDSSSSLSSAVKLENMVSHLQNLAKATATNNRAIGSGYDSSVDYVYNTLRTETDLIVSKQGFEFLWSYPTDFPQLTIVNPPITLTNNVDYAGVGGQGSIANANVRYLVGCSPDDFADFTPGDIVLEDAAVGGCDRTLRISYAANAGAAALLFFWSSYPTGAPRQYPCPSTVCTLPTFALTTPLANTLIKAQITGGVTASFTINVVDLNITLTNVIAETKDGDPNNVVVQGSHLDSVPNGLGINDNGSGSSANLEIAIQFSKLIKPKNKVRFCWWTAEEIGLIGSLYYVAVLPPAELGKIAFYLNYDMLASRNFYRGIYNARQASNPSLRVAGNTVQTMFEKYFDSQGLQYQPTGADIGERSDHYSFAQAGIPYGGIFTGAELFKNDNQTLMFGGVSNSAFDPCYHQACDSIDNMNQEALHVHAAAAATILEELAMKDDIRTFLGGTPSVTALKFNSYDATVRAWNQEFL